MAYQIKRLILWARKHPKIAISTVICAMVLLLLGGWRIWGEEDDTDQMVEHSLVVSPNEFRSVLTIAGTITPGQTIDITAPLDGTVSAIRFSFGDGVAANQILVEMDTTELEQKLRDTEVGYLKAKKPYDDMQNWSSSPDVSKAKRAAMAAKYTLDNTRRKVLETKGLLDKGLVPRDEYTDLVEQERSQFMALQSAQDDLRTALKLGIGEARKIAELDLMSAKVKWQEAKTQYDKATVKSPVTGVIVRPHTEAAGTESAKLHVGQHLTKGQLIGSVAQGDRLGVEILLSETDLENVHSGQRVTVSGPGFNSVEVSGVVASVSGEAISGQADAGHAMFPTKITLDPLTKDQALHIRIGMSANVSITTYVSKNAFVVPPEAIIGTMSNARVEVRDYKLGPVRLVSVTVGHTSPDSVEILSGLKKGDIVVWHTSADLSGN